MVTKKEVKIEGPKKLVKPPKEEVKKPVGAVKKPVIEKAKVIPPVVKKPTVSKVKEPINLVQAEMLVQPEAVQLEIVQEVAAVELKPKFAEAEEKRVQEVDNTEKNQEVIKALRVKLSNGTISDGEAQKLFALLSDK
jgi:hypothetical protein